MNMPAITRLTPTPTVLERLRRAGIAPSRQRVMIATTLFGYADHVTAQTLHQRVNRDFGPVCRATVYNTLNLLVEKGLIRSLPVDTDLTYYDPDTRPHHHVLREDTGQLWDLDPAQVQLLGLPNLPVGLKVSQVDLIVRVRPGQ